MIQLVNEDKSIFAECKIEESYDKKIDRCYDSTRFFAILIENDQGQKANIGLGFTDRNDAFDFISSLDDYSKQVRREKGVDQYDVKDLEKDFSLKEGEKIEIHIKGITDNKKKASKPKSGLGGGLKKLAPPRSTKKTEPAPSLFTDDKDNTATADEEGKQLEDIFN